MKLISLVNSGESLEKVVALVVTAYQSNEAFYNSFDKVVVFYGKNIIKSKSDTNIAGITKSLLKYDKNNVLNYSMNNLFNHKKEILCKLKSSNKITNRQFQKMMNNKKMFLSIINHMCWYDIFPELEHSIICKLKAKYNNLDIINLSLFDDIHNVITCIPHYQRFGKLYFYTYDGGTMSKKVSKLVDNKEQFKKLKKFEASSLYYTYNIYIFLMLVNFYLNTNNTHDYILGYRLMKSFPRKTYDVAINYLCSINHKKTIIEPRNIIFNKKLDTYMKYTSMNERSMHATYDIFFEFIEK